MRPIIQRSIIAMLCMFTLVTAQTRPTVRRYLATMPLDNELIELMPSKQKLTMMVTWDCPEIEGWELVTMPDGHKFVRDVEGREVEHYPRRVRFRFTIGSKTQLQGRSPLPYDTELKADQLASTLHFRLKQFHEIEARDFTPVLEEIIGVPADIPYDERIYRMEFEIPKIPITDRFALEVIDAKGNRVAKFPVFLL